ncbi:FixH family protein [Endothiovibrio diazotrophicus]
MSDQTAKGPFGISQSSKRAWRNPWVLGWIAMVALVFSINAFMVSQAFVTSPGLVNEQYYDKGENYHQTIAKRQLVASLGWDVSLDKPARPTLGKTSTYRLVAVDAAGQPLKADSVTLFAYRPADQRADFKVAFVEEGPGRFRADVDFPLKGIWDLVVQMSAQGHDYEIPERTKVHD